MKYVDLGGRTALAMLRDGYLTSKVIALAGGIYPASLS